MSCPQTGQILRLMAGELAPSEEAKLRQHLADCAACQSTWAGLRATWQALGEWEVDPPRDLRAAILAAASESEPQSSAVASRRMAGLRLLRIAASFALATGLGIAAGRAVPVAESQSSQPARPAPSDADLAEHLGITELGGGSATGLGRGLVMGTAPKKEKEASS